MKKIYSVIGCALLAFGANAQFIQTAPAGARVPHSVNRGSAPSTQSSQTFYVDYDYMDEAYAVDSIGISYTRYIWDMNMNFEVTEGDTSRQYAVTDFSAFYDANYGGGAMPIATSSFNTYTIDSVFILCGHENNSGINDTIIVKILALNAAGYPQTTVLHADTVIALNFNTTTNDWLSGIVVGVPVNYTVTSNTTRFAAKIEYWGAKQDTFGILAGFEDLGPGNCANIPALQNFAEVSHYAINSYVTDTRFVAQYGMLPTASGANLFYDCNGNGTYQAGTDSPTFIQNWGIWTRLTIDGVGINESGNSGIALEQNVPNPANGNTVIRYNIANASEVQFEVYDVTGQLIETVDHGTQTAGQHQIELNTADYAAGVYFYTINVNGVKVTKRMVISE